MKLPPSVSDVLNFAASRHGITFQELLSRRQYQSFVAARAHAARALRTQGYSLPAIARYLGLHHTSVMHYLRKPGTPLDLEPVFPDESGIWAI